MTPADGSGLITFYDEGLARRLKALACTAPPLAFGYESLLRVVSRLGSACCHVV